MQRFLTRRSPSVMLTRACTWGRMQQSLCKGACRAPTYHTNPRQRSNYPRSGDARCACLQNSASSFTPPLRGFCRCAALGSKHNGSVGLIPLSLFVSPGVAAAEDVVAYNAGSQSEYLQNLAGVVYVGLVAYLLYKVFTRRAKRFTSEKLTSAEVEPKPEDSDPELEEPQNVKPIDAVIGAVQALGIAAGLYFFATKMDSVLLSSPLPDQYTVRNMAVTVRTVLRGLVYLATFIFAANGVGLSALALKLLIFGDDDVAVASDKPKYPENIPKVGLTSNLDDVMRAFDEASDVTKYQKKKEDSK